MTDQNFKNKPLGDRFIAKEDGIYIIYFLMSLAFLIILIYSLYYSIHKTTSAPLNYIHILTTIFGIGFFGLLTWYYFAKLIFHDELILGDELLYYRGPFGSRIFKWIDIVSIARIRPGVYHPYISLKYNVILKNGRKFYNVAMLEDSWDITTRDLILKMYLKRETCLKRHGISEALSEPKSDASEGPMGVGDGA